MNGGSRSTDGLRFAANLKWLFTEVPFLERFDRAAAAGFRGVEYASPYEHAPAALARRLADAGLSQALINTPMGSEGSEGRRGLACVPSLRPEFEQGIRLALEYAAALDCGIVHVVAGIRPEGVSDDRAFAEYLRNVAWAAELAAQCGVTLVLEAQNRQDAPGFLLDSQNRAAAVVEAIGSAHVRLLFDVYHAQMSEGNLSESFRSLLPLIAHVQIADVPGRHEPGSGEIDYGHLFSVIEHSSYRGWIGCEYAPREGTESGLVWMKEQQ